MATEEDGSNVNAAAVPAALTQVGASIPYYQIVTQPHTVPSPPMYYSAVAPPFNSKFDFSSPEGKQLLQEVIERVKAQESEGIILPTEASESLQFALSEDFLSALYGELKGKVDKETWDAAVRKARASAGGKAKQKKKKQSADEPADNDTSLSPFLSPPDFSDDSQWKWAKSDEHVNYRSSKDLDRKCGACEYFKAHGACDLVAGLIETSDVCDQFSMPVAKMDIWDLFGWRENGEPNEEQSD
jgi:hypothetical protein